MSAEVKMCVQIGVRPLKCHEPYITRRDELSLEGRCILWETRVVIPLHVESHTDASRMKGLARSYVW